MNILTCFAGEYLAAVEWPEGKQYTLTIEGVKKVQLESIALGDDEGGSTKKVRDRGVVYFRETRRGWVLNKTCAQCLIAMWGTETDNWIGKRVTLYATPVQVGRKREPGIRVAGSPDLAQTITAIVKLPRKRDQPVKLVKTTRGSAPVQEQEATQGDPPAPPPEEDPVDAAERAAEARRAG